MEVLIPNLLKLLVCNTQENVLNKQMLQFCSKTQHFLSAIKSAIVIWQKIYKWWLVPEKSIVTESWMHKKGYHNSKFPP